MKGRFPALSNPHFRRFWFSQIVSLTGTWMQNLSLPWLAYTTTDSPLLLGLVGVVQFLPTMLLSLFAGAATDRWSKKAIVVATQGTMMVSAFALAVLVFSNQTYYPLLLAAAMATGIGNAFDFPARQALMSEIVGKDTMMNAVALQSSVFNAARIFGPAVAGIVMATWGIGWCFLINAITFVPTLVSLATIPSESRGKTKANESSLVQSVREGIEYALGDFRLRGILARVAMMGILAFNFSVLVPVLVREEFGLDETAYAIMTSCLGIGSFLAAGVLAARSRHGPPVWTLNAFPIVTAALFVAVAFSPYFYLTCVLMVFVGLANIGFFTTANSALQIGTRDEYRGRVMSFYSLLFGGLTPIGNLFSGLVVEWGTSRWGFGVSAALLIVCTLCLPRVDSLAPRADRS